MNKNCENTIKLGRAKAIPRLIAAGVFLAITLLFLALRNVTYISEYVFSRGISRWWITGAGTVFGIFPFSVFEIAAGCVFIYGGFCIVLAIVRLVKRRKSALLPISKLLLMVMIFSMVYAGTASFAYYRNDLIDELPHYQGTLTDEEAAEVVSIATAQMNALAEKFETDENGSVICPYTDEELEDICQSEYDRLESDYFSDFTAELKSLITSDIFSYFGILGISFQPTGEANYNKNTDPSDKPHTMLHELAHSKGIMYESDANLLAVYLCLTSENDFVRYSGYHNCYTQIARIQTLHHPEMTLAEACKDLGDLPRTHMNAAYARYASYESFVTDVGEFINDTYLKLSGAQDGTGSYYISGTVEQGKITYSPVQKVCICYLMSL